ncbi:MAG: bifunctional DNA-formamidopyrimidine glycosylase/DNA-(apurinic or apyrimidinic site) lyase [Candidatus Solibacter usitatus]|nr:bifunctional DNA-formamidopyrimidine glycosylase/DNA-(apurinic or apyrimidinic site) lyase [Candidatus Solibacter usitatus]
MPELPEVETIVRTLAPHVVGRRIVQARVVSPLVAAEQPQALAALLAGRLIRALRRRGKFIVFDLDDGVLCVHLRMTGKLLLDAAPGKFTRAVLELDSATLLFDDVRQFGRMSWSKALPPNVSRLGPEPFDLTPRAFAERLHARRGRLKPLLLNQAFIAGLGNIYVDEALFRAGVHPLAQASRLSRARAGRLHASIVEVLVEAIAAGGSSISDYVDAQGRAGGFQRFHRVYGREGEPCQQCASKVRRIVVAQRGTHLCPRCQRA